MVHADWAAEHIAAGLRELPPAAAGGRSADIYVAATRHLTGRFVDGRVVEASSTTDAGIARRVMAADGADYRFDDLPAPFEDGAHAGDLAWVTRLCHVVDDAARGLDPRVVQLAIDFTMSSHRISTASLDGNTREDSRELLYLAIRSVARDRGRTGTGYHTAGTSAVPFDLDAASIGQEVAGRAVTALDARPAPVGRLPVIISGGRGMVLIHEACCHPLEGDEVVRRSIYADRMGELVAAPEITIVDDHTVPGAAGSAGMDDEGTSASATMLVDEGRLAGFLTDLGTAHALGMTSSGNGRRASFRYPVLPRMTNTCVLAGALSPEEIIAGTERGLYAEHVGGGEVVEATGEFMFRVTSGRLVEHGRLTDRIAETTLAGVGHEVLRDIDAIGSDVSLGATFCGKHGQFVPVGLQGPTLRVRSLIVGGTDER